MKIIFATLIIFCIACNTTKTANHSSDYLRQYAFCRCLQHASPDSNLVKNDISMSIYLDIGGYGYEVFESADSLAKIAAENIQPSIMADHEGKKPVIMGCFEFYSGPQMDSLIKANRRHLKEQLRLTPR